MDEEKLKEDVSLEDEEDKKYKDILTKTLADFENYKKRVERDKNDMIFFLKSDILKKILPRIDDFERIINNTPEDLKGNPLYE
ncbi:MAG: nucleotide exchange factor GrpE [Candidatus Peribacteria bacterium]|nr:nucleotide exchange factor GrpE [Candidatus Peribacteria bacterium]